MRGHLLLLLIAITGWSQDIEISPRWKKGDVIRLEYSRTREDSRRPESNGTSKTPVDVEILSVDSKGSVVRWKNGPTKFPDRMKVPESVLTIQDKVTAMAIEIQLSPDGEFVALLNAKEVAAQMKQLMDEVTKEFAADPKTHTAMQAIMNPDMLLASASNDAKTYFGIYGAALKPKEKVKVRLEQPFPLNPAKTMPVDFELELVAMDGKLARLRSSTRFEEGGVQAAMAELFTKAGIKPEDLGKMPKVDLRDEGEFVFDTETGLMQFVAVDRRTEMPGALTRRDRKEFRLR